MFGASGEACARDCRSAHPGQELMCSQQRSGKAGNLVARKSSKSCCSGEGHLEFPGSANLQEMQNYLKSILSVLRFFSQDIIIL